MNTRFTFYMIILLITVKSNAQKSVLIEIGATYLTNNLPNPTSLNDFGALSINTRYLINKKENFSITLEAPISFTTKLNSGKTVFIGVQTPLLLTYSIGAGASDNISGKRMGYTIGAGAAWFYQQVRSKKNELPSYCEFLSQAGPIVKGGIRYPVKSLMLFKANGKEVYPSIGVNVFHQFNIGDRKKNIGSLSVMLGFAF